jgi:multidrug efflux pump subunit AcrA (membrane-fusion protein)
VKKPTRLSRLPLPRRPLEWGLAIVAVALVAIAVTSLGSGSSTSSAATKRTATSGKGVVQSTVSGNGTLEPAQKVELSFGASGEVTKVDVKAGETVKKGEVLAEVDSSSARASLASAEAQLVEAEEAVETAAEAEEEESTEEAAYTGGARTEFVGLMSEKGTSAAKAGSKETEATEEPAEEEPAPDDEETTSPKKSVEKETEAEKPVEKETETETSAPTESSGGSGETTPSGDSETSGGGSSESGGGETTGSTSGGGATVSLPTAEANLREAELTVKSAKQEVRETTLRAPISGTIASVSGSVGETVSGGSSGGGGDSEASDPEATGGESTGAFMVLAQLHRLKMEVSFSESDIGKVREGQTATVAIDSMEGTELAGEVTKVSVLPSEGSSSVVEYPATILLTQSAKGLRAGMSASAEVVVEQVKNAVTVPTEAISSLGQSKTVTVEEGGKEVTKRVTTGLEGDETAEVVSGLKAGATLVLPEVSIATVTESSGGEGESGAASAGGATFTFPGGGGGATGGPPGGGGFPGGGG